MTVEAPAALGWWVYGIVEPGAAPPRASGVGEGVSLLEAGTVAALVDRVDLGEFGEEPVRANLEDEAWLERRARSHEAVLEDALAQGTVVPFRFLTVYTGEDELRAFLSLHEPQLRQVLERVRGTVELGVKAFVDREALERGVGGRSPAVAELDTEIAAAAAGRRYLLERRRAQLARDEASRVVAALAADVHARLGAVALDAAVNALQPPELSHRPDQMVLNGAYLVRAGDDALPHELRRLEREHTELGVSFELTGPWPPYNFVPRELEER